MKKVLLSISTVLMIIMFSGCDVAPETYYDCSELTLEEKKMMSETIQSQMELMSRTFETISDSSYHPETRSANINKIIDNINMKVKEQFCVRRYMEYNND